MSENNWKHFITLTVSGKPPSLCSGTDPKGAAHKQYPLITALETQARIVGKEALQNIIPDGRDVRLEIVCRRWDFGSKSRVNSTSVIGGISSALTGMFYFADRDIREVLYTEEQAADGGEEGYEVKVYSR